MDVDQIDLVDRGIAMSFSRPKSRGTVRRINFYAGPCAGKSTIAARIFSDLKVSGYNVEFVREYIKSWTFINRHATSFDQGYVLTKQIQQEDTMLRAGVDLVVSESPTLMTVYYAFKNNDPGWEHLLKYALVFENTYSGIHIMLDREGLDYKELGRFENREEAKEIDSGMLPWIKKYTPNLVVIPTKNYYDIVSCVQSALEQSSCK